jgi:hypothetical protein
MGTKWNRLIAKMRKLDNWVATEDGGAVTIRIGGWLDALATFTEEQYVEAVSFYEGYTSAERKPDPAPSLRYDRDGEYCDDDPFNGGFGERPRM